MTEEVSSLYGRLMMDDQFTPALDAALASAEAFAATIPSLLTVDVPLPSMPEVPGLPGLEGGAEGSSLGGLLGFGGLAGEGEEMPAMTVSVDMDSEPFQVKWEALMERVNNSMGILQVDANTGLASAKVSELVANINAMTASIQVSAHVTDSPGGAAIEARAEGGTVLGGHPYLVGEEGAEVIVPGRTGTVIPHDAPGGGGSGGIHLYNPQFNGITDVVAFADAMERLQRRRGF